MSENSDDPAGSGHEARQEQQQAPSRGRSGEGAASILPHLAREGNEADRNQQATDRR